MKKAWDVALAPARAIPMNAFMLWMSGNSLQIFSILITVMLFWNSLKSLMAVHGVFERFAPVVASSAAGDAKGGDGTATPTTPKPTPSFIVGLLDLPSDPLVLQKLAYMAMQLVLVGLGVWKCNGMGLLPTSTSDWLAFELPKALDDHVLRWVASAGGVVA
jgi:ER membrane protein complex subunit 4